MKNVNITLYLDLFLKLPQKINKIGYKMKKVQKFEQYDSIWHLERQKTLYSKTS